MKKLLASIIIVFCANVFASSQSAKVKSLVVRASDGLTYFTLEGVARDGKPACATKSYWMIRDENSEVGKKQYSLVLAAHASGKPIQVSGFNTCTRWGDGEDVNAITLVN